MPDNANPTDRILYLDALRAYAIFLVIFSHVFAPVCEGMNSYSRPVWASFIVLDSIIRLCVPLFVMISGKLLLGSKRDDSPLEFLRRRLSKIVVPFFVWSIIYARYEAFMNEEQFSLVQSVRQFFMGPTEFHLWFMYMIIAIYFIAPFVRIFTRAADRRHEAYAIAAWFVLLALQFFSESYSNSGPAATMITFGGYFLLGHALDRLDVPQRWIKWLVIVVFAIVLFNAYETVQLMLANGGQLDETYFGYVTPLVAVYAAAFFLIVKSFDLEHFYEKIPLARRVVDSLSSESYNLYLIHVFFLWMFIKAHLGFELSEKTGGNPYVGVALTTSAIFACSWALSVLLQKIPIARRLLVIPAK